MSMSRGFLLATTLACASTASWAVDNEYQIKAAFIYNIARLVVWPRPLPTGEPMEFCILGHNPFGSALDTIRGKKVHGHPLAIREILAVESFESCQIVYLGEDTADQADEWLEHLAMHGILTVGDRKHFAHEGGMINLLHQTQRIQIEINLGAVRESGLSISARLLALANIIDSRTPSSSEARYAVNDPRAANPQAMNLDVTRPPLS